MHVGQAAQELRNHFGLSLSEGAAQLGMTANQLAHLELGESFWTVEVSAKYQAAWNVDPMVYVVAFYSKPMPDGHPMKAATEQLNSAWREEYRAMGIDPFGDED